MQLRSMLDQEVIDKKVLYDKIVDMLLSGPSRSRHANGPAPQLTCSGVQMLGSSVCLGGLGELEGPVADVSCGPGHVLAMLQDRQAISLLNIPMKYFEVNSQANDYTETCPIRHVRGCLGQSIPVNLHNAATGATESTASHGQRPLPGHALCADVLLPS